MERTFLARMAACSVRLWPKKEGESVHVVLQWAHCWFYLNLPTGSSSSRVSVRSRPTISIAKAKAMMHMTTSRIITLTWREATGSSQQSTLGKHAFTCIATSQAATAARWDRLAGRARSRSPAQTRRSSNICTTSAVNVPGGVSRGEGAKSSASCCQLSSISQQASS